jgi:predicted metal-dependent phosphoesterase TrpH
VSIDLHVHSRTGSDGAWGLEEIFDEAVKRGVTFIAITDHDAIRHQGEARRLAGVAGLRYLTGVELNVTFPWRGRDVPLDFLGYGFDYENAALDEKLETVRAYRARRARQIVDNLNGEFRKEGLPLFSEDDLTAMQENVDGILSRPHIADYLVKKGIVKDRQAAFDRYLVVCDVPKYPLHLDEASRLIRGAGGRLVLAHPNDPNGTSLVKVRSLEEQTRIIEQEMLEYIDGIECWHARADAATTAHYLAFCAAHGLMMTGGSDDHQKPVRLGTVDVPDEIAGQFEGLR